MRRCEGFVSLLVTVGLTLAVAQSCSKPKPVVAPPMPSGEAAPASQEPMGSQPSTTEITSEPSMTAAGMPESGVSSSELPADLDELNEAGFLKDVFFDTNKADLTSAARDELAINASWLKAHPTVKIVIEGHCDERNTEEYNLALGWRRANAAKSYLASLGIDSDRVGTISYGEERPFAACNAESCWWQNRRAHFVITAK